MEEYSIAKQFYRYTSVDMCELARNSVLQSGVGFRFVANIDFFTNMIILMDAMDAFWLF